MTNLDFSAEPNIPLGPLAPDEAELAAVAFLARYSGRTLDAYRHDLRNLFQWAADHNLAVLKATRAHLELYRGSMEERGLAASTIDRRLSTACGFYRFAVLERMSGWAVPLERWLPLRCFGMICCPALSACNWIAGSTTGSLG